MTTTAWLWLFWISAGFILYTYLGYPLILLLLRFARKSPPPAAAGATPAVSIILTVRNEQAHIQEKLHSLLSLDYPAERFEVLVASDGSTDATNEIVRACPDPRLRLIDYDGGIGKAEAINRTVPQCRGEVVVLTDARQRVEPGALRALARQFADPQVGIVGGEMVIVDGSGSPTSEGTGLYWRFERRIRSLEAELGLLTGVSGCFFGIRRAVYRPVPPGSYCEDVALVLYARSSGWQVRWEREARVYEQLRTQEVEFARKVRTLVGNYQLLAQFWRLYLPWRGSLAFTLVSHKLCRLFTPLALAGVLAASAALASHSPVYAAALGIQASVYTLGLIGILSGPSRRRLRVANVCGTFCMLNGAAIMALVHVIRHGPRISWR
jgi:biofilm PGA synthesis N-glycosyltransferase PgaC